METHSKVRRARTSRALFVLNCKRIRLPHLDQFSRDTEFETEWVGFYVDYQVLVVGYIYMVQIEDIGANVGEHDEVFLFNERLQVTKCFSLLSLDREWFCFTQAMPS